MLWMAGLLSSVMGSVPVTIAMAPILTTMIPPLTGQVGEPLFFDLPEAQPLWWSLALGACLGGNGTLFGAPANVVVSQIANRNHYPVSFFSFMRYGIPITLMTLTLSSIYIWLRYFALT
jgi:Na+/H+ antiporter NhaD/arsenite permease-like protein